MREQFTHQKFHAGSLKIIDTANAICRDMRSQGFDVTLRQLYYQFVSHHGLANKQSEYKRLGSIINDARLAGLMDWRFIQDRTREVNGNFAGWDNPGQFIENMADHYFEAIWEGQEYRPEIWVEKDALKDVVGQACGDTRTPYFSCRGYVSQSEMYEAAKRFENRRNAGLEPIIIHLGDHDPSGIDMTRDIQDRLTQMSWGHVEVRRIALNMDQIEQYSPPPNPAKITDSRAVGYIEEYGEESWELDALSPAVLRDLIQDELATVIDFDLMEERREHERQQEERLGTVTSRWDDLEANWDEILDIIGH